MRGLVEVPGDVIDEARKMNEFVEELLAGAPSVHTVPPEVTRRLRAEGKGPFGPVVRRDDAVDRTVPTPAGDVRVRTLAPERPAAVYLHLHGGGWTLGAADQQDLLLGRLADGAGVAVVSVDYRLAPEHPFPAGPDDCEAVALWLIEHARDEWGTDRLMIGGESAGAHLSLLTLLRLRDRHDTAGAFVGANLVFGAYDLGMTPSQRLWGDRNLILSRPIIEWFVECFTPGLTPEERRDPAISPLYADLRGLPPALLTAGALDPLLDDTLFLADRWEAAGNEAELAVYPEAIHGFHALRGRLGDLSIVQQVDAVRRWATS
jgi:acetyl esterase/lipase